MATKKAVNFSIDVSVMTKIRKAAKEDQRNISNQVERIFTEWLKARKEK